MNTLTHTHTHTYTHTHTHIQTATLIDETNIHIGPKFGNKESTLHHNLFSVGQGVPLRNGIKPALIQSASKS